MSGELPRLPNGAHQIKVGDRAWIYVTPANGVFPPRAEYNDIRRWTALVPADRIREFADTELDATDRARLLTLLDALAPWVKGRV